MTSEMKKKLRGMLELLNNKALRMFCEAVGGLLVGGCIMLGFALLFIMGD